MEIITSKRKTLKQILKTSLPAAADLSSQTITWLIEAILIGHLSTAALAGVGIAQQIILLTFSTLLTFVMGSSIIVARYLGANDHWNANHVLGQSLMVGIFLSFFIAFVWYFLVPYLFILIREDEPIARIYGVQYITTAAWFTPLVVTNFIALGILRGAGETMWSMKINLFIQVLHLTLAPLLIFGLWIFPRLETIGAGLAVGIAHSTGFILTIVLLRSRRVSLFLAITEITRPNFTTFKRLVKIGIPTTIEQMVWAIGQLVMSIYAGWMGIIVLATHQVFIRIQGVLTMVFFGFGIGSMTLVGKSLGAAHIHQAKRTGMINGLVGFGVASIIAVFIILSADFAVSIFTDDPAVIYMGRSLIWIFALIQLPKGANIVFSGNLRGSAELAWLMWLAISTVCVFEIFGSWLLAIQLGLGLSGLWIVQGIDELTRFSLNFWRFNRGKWKEVRL
jgi:putative MATE family efflux protein